MEFQREPGRIYAEEEGRVIAEVTFPDRDGAADIDHTFVDDTLRGQGVAGQLLQAAADQIRAEGKRARATCSYAEIWFERHPERGRSAVPLRDDESRRAGGSSMALRAAFPATIPVMTGFLVPGDCLWPFDAVQGVWAGMVRPHERHRFRRQYAVCGRHAADHGF